MCCRNMEASSGSPTGIINALPWSATVLIISMLYATKTIIYVSITVKTSEIEIVVSLTALANAGAISTCLPSRVAWSYGLLPSSSLAMSAMSCSVQAGLN